MLFVFEKRLADLMKFILCFFCFSLFATPQKTVRGSVKIQPLKSIKFSTQPLLKPHIIQNTQPLIVGDKVIQGDSFTGLKAFHRQKGHLLWWIPISNGGVGSSLIAKKNIAYFGGSDGFFYAVDLKKGQLSWKFFTGSENINSPILFNKVIYWMASNQKIYAHEAKEGGKLLWVYSGPSLPKGFFTRGSGGLVVKDGLLYGGFYDGSLVALELKNGMEKWSLPKKSFSHSISFRLALDGECLLAPILGSGLFCLDRFTGKTLWKAPGGSSHPVKDSSGILYQAGKQQIYALSSENGRPLWTKKSIGEPVFFSPYKKFVIYGSVSDGYLHIADRQSGKKQDSFLFGKGLASPVTVIDESNEAWFFSIQGYLHKIRFIF